MTDAMPTIPARERQRHAYRDPVTHRFAARPDSAVTRLPTPPIGRMPRTPDGLSDDAWPDIATQAVDMPAPPKAWPSGVEPIGGEPIERETWHDWANDIGYVAKWCALFVAVFATLTHVAGWWGQ